MTRPEAVAFGNGGTLKAPLSETSPKVPSSVSQDSILPAKAQGKATTGGRSEFRRGLPMKEGPTGSRPGVSCRSDHDCPKLDPLSSSNAHNRTVTLDQCRADGKRKPVSTTCTITTTTSTTAGSSITTTVRSTASVVRGSPAVSFRRKLEGGVSGRHAESTGDGGEPASLMEACDGDNQRERRNGEFSSIQGTGQLRGL